MEDKELYQRIPGLERPWSVSDVELDVEQGRVDIRAEHEPGVSWLAMARVRQFARVL